MFRKTLRTMVEGLRSPGVTNQSVYVSRCIDEIKSELKSSNDKTKAQALSKLVYLKLTGIDIRWASFNIIEVMSMAQFRYKRVGYLAAEQVFDKNTEVILLCNNLLKKQLGSKDPYEIGLALSCLSNIVTPDLARDLLQDITTLMSKSRIPYVRQKATLIMYKLFLEYPEGLRLSFDDLKERLSEKNVGVCGAAVNVICELSAKNPRNYLPLAPVLFDLLINATNNWMLIKVVKLLARLVQEEPRLARKILAPLRDLILKTQAKSVQYEALYAAACTIPFAKKKNGQFSSNVPAVVETVDQYLRDFVEDADQNLKFLGLLGMEKLLESHPDHVRQHSAIIMSCLSDIDVTIKMQALQLVDGIVAADNLQLVCDQLAENLTSAPPGAYRDALGHKIIQVCSRNRYALVRDFGWYLSLLVNKVCRVDSSAFEDQIAAQLVAVVVRVPPVQQPAVQMLLPLLAAGIAINGPVVDQDAPMVVLDAVLRAAAWVVAEYGDAGKTDADAARKLFKIFSLLINSRTRTLSPASQAVFLHSALKVLLRVLSIHNAGDLGNDIRPALAQMCELVTTHAPPLAGLLDATNEVRMRVHNLTQAAAAVAARVGVTSDTQAGAPADAATGTADLLQRLVAYAAARATPVSAKAQGRVAIPDGLRMKKWISKPAKQRAIAARSRILEQRSGTASGRPTRYSLANLRITEEDDDGDRKDGSDSGDDNGGGGDDSSDEFAQFRTNSGDEGSSSSGEAAPASEADQKRALFYIGGGGGSGGKSKKSKKAKKRSSKPRSPKQSSLSEVLNGSADTTSAAPITASVILGSDDDSDDAAATRRGQAGDALAGIDLSAPSNDGLSFEALKQRHRTDVAASEATPSAVSAKAKKDKKKKDKKKKDKKKKDKKSNESPSAPAARPNEPMARPKAPSVNLLDFGAEVPSPAAAPAPAQTGGGGASDILGLFGASEPARGAGEAETGNGGDSAVQDEVPAGVGALTDMPAAAPEQEDADRASHESAKKDKKKKDKKKKDKKKKDKKNKKE